MSQPVSLIFLGGLGAIGRNCMAIMQGGRLLIIDCGVMFPSAETPGVDAIIPDLRWIIDRIDKIDGCIATHAHFDHIGAFHHLLKHKPLPVYGSRFTMRLLADRLNEEDTPAPLHIVEDRGRRKIGEFDCEFIPVPHSIPGAMSIVIRTSAGAILHTGDFKLDNEPTDGRVADLDRIRTIAKSEGFRVLLSDSTNSCQSGYAPTERQVVEELRIAFAAHTYARLIVVCFATNLFRIQTVLDLAADAGRIVATMGMSMRRVIDAGVETGDLRLRGGAQLADIMEVTGHDPRNVVILSTGSQGGSGTALSAAATGKSRLLKLGPRDVVIMSTKAIPGNEESVATMEASIVDSGAKLVNTEASMLHATGHGHSEELRAMIRAASPNYLVPIHGEPKHLVEHSRHASAAPATQALLVRDGDVLVLSEKGLTPGTSIPAPYVYVDGPVVGLPPSLLRDRLALGLAGVLVISVTLSEGQRKLQDVSIDARGWRGVPETEAPIAAIEELVRLTIKSAPRRDVAERDKIISIIRQRVQASLPRGRRPLIVVLCNQL